LSKKDFFKGIFAVLKDFFKGIFAIMRDFFKGIMLKKQKNVTKL